jgi:uncharacterized protein (TIGR03435 family)
MLTHLIATMVLAASAYAQPAFEVASVKAAQQGGRPLVKSDPAQWSCLNCSLEALLTQAYAVFEYQIDGPAWMKTTRFDVAAKLPAGGARDFRQMLQALLTERFKMKTHRESREMPVYELVIGKGGPKLEEVATPAPAPPPRPAVDRDGFPNIPGGTGLLVFNGRGRMQFRGQIMKNVAHYLSGQVDRPVLDATGLKGTYAMTLSWPMEEGETIFDALERQLGLKLKATKGSVDMVVVEHVEKTPIEN